VRGPKIVAGGTALLLAGALVVSGLALVQTNSNSEQTCKAALLVRDATVAVLVDAQNRSRRTPAQTASEQQRKDAEDFFDHAIGTLRAVECPR
jgi:hypothetical protein